MGPLTSYSIFTHESGEQGIRGSEIEHQLSEFLRQKNLIKKILRQTGRWTLAWSQANPFCIIQIKRHHENTNNWPDLVGFPLSWLRSLSSFLSNNRLERALLFAEEPKRAHLSKLKSRLTGPIFADVSHGVDVQKSCCLSNSQQRRLNLTLQFHTAATSWLGNRNLKQIIITECWSSFFTIFGQIDL